MNVWMAAVVASVAVSALNDLPYRIQTVTEQNRPRPAREGLDSGPPRGSALLGNGAFSDGQYDDSRAGSLAALLTTPLSIIGAPTRGSEFATVVIVEYMDFECPYCRRYARDTGPAIEREYVRVGKVKVVFRNLPLSRHPHAFEAAVGGICADDQGTFWRYHDGLLAEQSVLTTERIMSVAQASGVNARVFASCLSKQGPDRLREEIAAARRLGVLSTPTFLMGRTMPSGRVRVLRRIPGDAPLATFKTGIDGMVSAIPR